MWERNHYLDGESSDDYCSTIEESETETETESIPTEKMSVVMHMETERVLFGRHVIPRVRLQPPPGMVIRDVSLSRAATSLLFDTMFEAVNETQNSASNNNKEVQEQHDAVPQNRNGMIPICNCILFEFGEEPDDVQENVVSSTEDTSHSKDEQM